MLMAIMASILLSCTKEQERRTDARLVSISATLSEALTKVTFTSDTDGQGHAKLALTWAEGDQIRVYNHDDHSQYQDFTLDAGSVGQKTGTFYGSAIVAASYDMELVNPSFAMASQTQPSDGSTGNIKYLASVEDVADYTSVVFSNVSGVLFLRTKLPSTDVAAAIGSVDIIASESIFYDNGLNDGKTPYHYTRYQRRCGGRFHPEFLCDPTRGQQEHSGGYHYDSPAQCPWNNPHGL